LTIIFNKTKDPTLVSIPLPFPQILLASPGPAHISEPSSAKLKKIKIFEFFFSRAN